VHNISRLLSVLIMSLLICETTQSAHASTITIGETNVLSIADSGNANLLAAQNATLPEPATIESLSFYVTQASGNLVLGIYDASGPNGGPGALKAQTNSFTPVVGWNTANVIAPVSLPAGTYWLAYLPSTNSLSFMKGLTSGVSIRYYSYQFGALPAQFSTSPSSDPNHWSFYGTLNPAPTISSVSLSNKSFTAGAPAGTVIGAISVKMSSGSFTGSFSLSGANASSFKIVGSHLETNGVLPAGSYNINITATQSGAANSPFTQAETITAVSQSISSVSLSNASFVGGSPSGTVVGTINATMSPSSPAFSGSLSLSTAQGGCTATNGANNSSFAISGGKLVTSGTVAPGTYAVCILSTQAGATNSPLGQAKTITALQSISSISLSNSSVVGGSPSGTVVGTINVAMSPSSPAFAGSLSLSTTQGGCTATNGANNSSFAISGGNLVTSGTMAPGTYSVCLLATQAGATNSPFGRTLTITASSQSTTSLNANPTTITKGQSSTLTWSSTGATSCTGTNFSTGSVSPVSGSTTVSPAQTTTYTVACTNGTNSASASATVTVSGIQTISSIALSNNSTTTGLSSGTPIGTLSAIMNPLTPAFSYTGTNLHLSTTGTDSGGVCNSTNGAGNGSFQIINGDTLATNGTLNSGSNSICVAASEAGLSANGQAFTINVGNPIDAAATYCSANGGGDGSSGNPWQAACIQAAINAAANGDTVFLAAGNWELQISQAPVITGNKLVNLTGAGSGNTFDAFGHPNNGSGDPVGTNTRVYTSGTSGPGGGYIVFGNYNSLGSTGCSGANPGPLVSHLYFDGSLAQSETTWSEFGDYNGTINFQSCPNATVNDIRVKQCCTFTPPSPNAQFWVRDSNNFTMLNSVSTTSVVGGVYTNNQTLQLQEMSNILVKNNIFYAQSFNPIYVDSITFASNYTWAGTDAFGTSGTALNAYGATGCSKSFCYANGGGTTGSYHFFVFDNYFSAVGQGYGTGGGVNDPSTSGISNDLQYNGNWIIGDTVALDSCEWHQYGYCASGVPDPGVQGMQVNGFASTNNSLVGTTNAQLNATGTGCTPQGTGPLCSNSQPNMQMVNFSASKNYLSSPSNQYLSDSNTITPSVSGNFCAGSAGGAWCTTTGFTNPPTGAFTLNPLSGSVVPFNTTTFTAQYGAVKWLASTSPTTPTSRDSRWNFLPPISLAATHGNTVYLWVMDSANHISAAASAVVP
jgi:hypothetical protein